jgi:hypothetical protein
MSLGFLAELAAIFDSSAPLLVNVATAADRARARELARRARQGAQLAIETAQTIRGSAEGVQQLGLGALRIAGELGELARKVRRP